MYKIRAALSLGNDIRGMEGLDHMNLNEFFKSTISDKTSKKKAAHVTRKILMTPSMTNERRKAIKTSTGVHVGVNVISWAKLDSKLKLLAWDCWKFPDFSTRTNILNIVDLLQTVCNDIPESDVYVFEEAKRLIPNNMNAFMFSVQMRRSQVYSALVTLLAARNKDVTENNEMDSVTMTNNLYLLRQFVPARMFDLQVGGEVVSAQDVVDKILYEETMVGLNVNGLVCIDSALMKVYKNMEPYLKDQMSQSLLLAVAFVNLVILQNSSFHEKRDDK